ncbi:MAG: translocation/assembly module TamB domain-containing protein [Pseudomonadota bacterium]
MRRLTKGVSLLVLLSLFLLPAFVVGTRQGAVWLLNLAKPQLSVHGSDVSGTLWSGLDVAKLSVATDAGSVVLAKLSISLRLGCIVKSKVCIRELRVGTISMSERPTMTEVGRLSRSGDATGTESQATGASGANAWPPDQLPWMPFKLSIERFSIERVLLARMAAGQAYGPLAGQVQVEKDAAVVSIIGADLRFGDGFKVAGIRSEAELNRSGAWSFAAELDVLAPGVQDRFMPPQWLALEGEGDMQEAALRLTIRDESDVSENLHAKFKYDSSVSEDGFAISGFLAGLDQVIARRIPDFPARPSSQLHWELRSRGDQLSLLASLSFDQPVSSKVLLRLEREARRWNLEEFAFDQEGYRAIQAEGVLATDGVLSPDLTLELNRLEVPMSSDTEPLFLSSKSRLSATASALTQFDLVVDELELVSNFGKLVGKGSASYRDEQSLPTLAFDGTWRNRPISVTSSANELLLTLPQGFEEAGLQVDKMQARLLTGESEQVQVELRGDLSTSLTLDLVAIEDGYSLTLQPFAMNTRLGGLRSAAVANIRPITGLWSQTRREVALDPFCLKLSSSALCTSKVARLGRNTELSLNLDIFEEHSGSLQGKPYEVELQSSGVLKLSQEEGKDLGGSLALDIQKFSIDPLIDTRSQGPLNFDTGLLEASIDESNMTAKLTLTSGSLGSIEGALSNQNGRALGRLRAQGLELTELRDIVPEFNVYSGLAQADLSFELPPLAVDHQLRRADGAPNAAMDFTGSFEISELAMRIPGSETPLENFSASGRAVDGVLSFEGEGLLGNGSINAKGRCCEQQMLKMTLRGTDTSIQLESGANTRSSSELQLQVGAQSADLSGVITVHEGTLPLAKFAEGGVVLADDIREVEVASSGPRRFDLKSDIELELEPGFTLRSRELELTLSGTLRARTVPLAPAQVFGDLQVLGGEIRAFGQSLRVVEGTISFLGDASNPGLALRAERTIRGEDLRVGFRVAGSVDEPVLDLYSDPVRPEREVLSYLLRGRGPDVGAGADGTAMALSLGATALNQLGALGALNAIPGLSQVQLSAEGEQGDTQATISGYVGERLYLSYGVGIYEPVNALTARLYLQSRLWLEVVSRLESSLDLYYRFDIAARQSPQEP